MKAKILILLLSIVMIGFTACKSTSGKVGHIDPNDITYFEDPNDITYFEDPRTGICYAIIGAKEGASFDQSTSIGMTMVPCEKVQKHLKK